MLPALLLAAVVPSAVSGMDKEATAQEASGLLRGEWVRMDDQPNPGLRYVWKSDLPRRLALYCGRHKLAAGSLRLLPSGPWYVFVAAWEGGKTARVYLDFRGGEFRLVDWGHASTWQRKPAP